MVPGNESEKWNQRYAKRNPRQPAEPALVLTQNVHLLPASGTALDLACGLAANAIFLAKRGLTVFAWDYSRTAIELNQQETEIEALNIDFQNRDVVAHPPLAQNFDVIIVSRFLNREIIPQLKLALKPRGLIFYQTFIQNKDPAVGPNNPDFLLADNELLQLFADLKILLYREEADIGDLGKGFRNEAMLIAQKPVDGTSKD